MQNAMHDQVGGVIRQGFACGGGFGRAGVIGDGDVAKFQRAIRIGFWGQRNVAFDLRPAFVSRPA